MKHHPKLSDEKLARLRLEVQQANDALTVNDPAWTHQVMHESLEAFNRLAYLEAEHARTCEGTHAGNGMVVTPHRAWPIRVSSGAYLELKHCPECGGKVSVTK